MARKITALVLVLTIFAGDTPAETGEALDMARRPVAATETFD